MAEYVATVTIKNLADLSFLDMMEGLAPYLLEEVPEGGTGDPDTLTKIDRQLGRFANLHAYLIYLYSFAANEANRLKLISAMEQYHLMVRKKDSLYEFSRAVKLKWEACSRMLTKALGYDEGDNPPSHRDYRDKDDTPNKSASSRPKLKGWNNVPT